MYNLGVEDDETYLAGGIIVHNCRSLRIAIIDGKAIGNRPARPFTQKQLLREFTKNQGVRPVGDRANLPFGLKKQYDTFAQGRMRELTGTIPAKVTYQQWLTRQSAAFQDDTLGITRARLFRKGDLQLPRFVNRAGDEIPLNQLARTARKAFIQAGLDPEDFL